ncbi:Asparagine--tRNA ligase, cytoplasmic 2, partial [Linum grandiflorum]
MESKAAINHPIQDPKPTSDHVEQHHSPPPQLSYSNRVLLKTILDRTDGGEGFLGTKFVIGGWVRTSKHVVHESHSPSEAQVHDRRLSRRPKDVTCAEMLQARIPLFRSIYKILGGGGGGGGSSPARAEKPPSPEPRIPRPPPPSTAFLLVSDGSCSASLQVVVDSSVASPEMFLNVGTSLVVEGILRQPHTPGGKHRVELHVEKLLHIGTVERNTYPLSVKRIPLENLRDASHFRQRSTTVASVMRIRSALTFASHTFFQNGGFLYVQLPIITATDAEGFSNKFQVTTMTLSSENAEAAAIKKGDGGGDKFSADVIKAALREKSNLVEELRKSGSNREALAAAMQDLRKTGQLADLLEAEEKREQQLKAAFSTTTKIKAADDYFSRQVYLTVSGRLHLESYACALGNVYAFGPRFRADRNVNQKLQAAEMWMFEVEMAFSQLKDAMNCAEDHFKFMCKWILENCTGDMGFITSRIDKNCISRLHEMTSTSFERITYMDAVEILKKVTHKQFETSLVWGIDLTSEHLSYLADEMFKKPVIVYNHPRDIRPFYARLNDDLKTVATFDMVVPKVGKLITGSQNEERIHMVETRIKELGLPTAQYEWYLDLRRHGTVEHSGFSLAFDLMVLFVTGLPDVRDAIPFPRSIGKAN